MIKQVGISLILLLSILSCTTTVEQQSAPKSLSYNGSKEIRVKFGQAFISNSPTVNDGGLAITSYIITSNLIPEISINSTTGIFTIDNNLNVGIYLITVKLTNSKGSLNETISIVIEANSVSNLVYTPNTLSLKVGNNEQSTIPAFNNGGSSYIRFLFNNIVANGIKIDSLTGVISTSNALAAGNYPLSVKVKNSFSSTTFNNVFTINVLLADAAPSGLNYSPNSLTLETGVAGTSVIPTIQSNGQAITSYNLLSLVAGITINSSTGVISVNNSLAIGNYNLNLSVTNSVGTTTFNTIFTVIIKAPPTAPVSISYSPNSLSFNQGLTSSSNLPIINDGGTAITSFELISAPTGITINSQGRIIFANNISVGTHLLTVKLTNSKGSSTFNNVFNLTVLAKANITYSVNIAPLMDSKCGGSSCHPSNASIMSYNGAKSFISDIISRTASGNMPKTGSLTQAQKDLFTQWQTDGLLEN